VKVGRELKLRVLKEALAGIKINKMAGVYLGGKSIWMGGHRCCCCGGVGVGGATTVTVVLVWVVVLVVGSQK